MTLFLSLPSPKFNSSRNAVPQNVRPTNKTKPPNKPKKAPANRPQPQNPDRVYLPPSLLPPVSSCLRFAVLEYLMRKLHLRSAPTGHKPRVPTQPANTGHAVIHRTFQVVQQGFRAVGGIERPGLRVRGWGVW